jgi:hypothetical protein
MERNPSEAGADGDNLGQIFIQGYNDAGTPELIDYFQLFTEIADASDGTEDARQIHYVMTGGSQRSRIEHNATETVINEDSVDLDFRVESDNNTSAFFVKGDDGKVGINTTAPNLQTSINFDTSAVAGLGLHDTNSGNLGGMLQFYSGSGQGTLRANIMNANNDGVHFAVGNGSIVFNQNSYVAADALDDYEQGTYTPVLASSGATFSYSVQQGTFVKIGELVYLQFNITLNANPSGTTSNVVFLDNIPFNTHDVHDSLYGGGHIGHYFNINLSAGTTMVYQTPINTTNQLELKEVGDNIGENSVVASELQNGSVIRGSVMYRSV